MQIKENLRLGFLRRIIYYPPSSGIEVIDDSSYITVKNNDLYTLKFRKASRQDILRLMLTGSSYDAIGKNLTKTFISQTLMLRLTMKENIFSQTGLEFEGFQIIEQNAITKVRYGNGCNNVLKILFRDNILQRIHQLLKIPYTIKIFLLSQYTRSTMHAHQCLKELQK